MYNRKTEIMGYIDDAANDKNFKWDTLRNDLYKKYGMNFNDAAEIGRTFLHYSLGDISYNNFMCWAADKVDEVMFNDFFKKDKGADNMIVKQLTINKDYKKMYNDEKVVCHKLQLENDELKKQLKENELSFEEQQIIMEYRNAKNGSRSGCLYVPFKVDNDIENEDWEETRKAFNEYVDWANEHPEEFDKMFEDDKSDCETKYPYEDAMTDEMKDCADRAAQRVLEEEYRREGIKDTRTRAEEILKGFLDDFTIREPTLDDWKELVGTDNCK